MLNSMRERLHPHCIKRREKKKTGGEIKVNDDFNHKQHAHLQCSARSSFRIMHSAMGVEGKFTMIILQSLYKCERTRHHSTQHHHGVGSPPPWDWGHFDFSAASSKSNLGAQHAPVFSAVVAVWVLDSDKPWPFCSDLFTLVTVNLLLYKTFQHFRDVF